jgi:hypothetical protein
VSDLPPWDALNRPIVYPWETAKSEPEATDSTWNPPEWAQAFPDPEPTPLAPPVATRLPLRRLIQAPHPVAYPMSYRRRRRLMVCGIALIVFALLGGGVAIARFVIHPSVLTSNSSCAGDDSGVELGLQVKNASRRTVTLTGATMHGLPSDLTPGGPVSWTECDLGSGEAAPKRVAPGAEQWVTLPFDSDGTCPKGSPMLSVNYTDESGAHTATLPLGSLSDLMSGIPPCQ